MVVLPVGGSPCTDIVCQRAVFIAAVQIQEGLDSGCGAFGIFRSNGLLQWQPHATEGGYHCATGSKEQGEADGGVVECVAAGGGGKAAGGA